MKSGSCFSAFLAHWKFEQKRDLFCDLLKGFLRELRGSGAAGFETGKARDAGRRIAFSFSSLLLQTGFPRIPPGLPDAREPQAKRSRRRRGRLMIVVWVLLLSVGILCLLLLLFARDAFVTDLSVFLVSLLHLAASLLCLLGLLMLCVFFLFCRQFRRVYENLLNANARYAQRIRRRREDLAWGSPRYPWVGHGTYDPW